MTDTAPLPVIINRSGGTASARGKTIESEVSDAFAAAGRSIVLELIEGKDVPEAVKHHSAAPRIAVGGGDGTLGGAAGILADSATEMAVLPLGTRNHFARQLDIPLDIAGAAQLAATGSAVRVDLGGAGECTFINNASLGAYVELVREREKSALPKWLASSIAGWRVLRKLRAQTFDLAIDGSPEMVRTAMLFFGNNRYEVAEGRPGEREALDDGLLSLFALAPLSRLAVVRAAIRVLAGRPDIARDFALVKLARKVSLHGNGQAAIALDGERVILPLPLDITVQPRALKVVAPHA